MFTARYGLSFYVIQTRFVLKGFNTRMCVGEEFFNSQFVCVICLVK